jgi:hypothetical protein
MTVGGIVTLKLKLSIIIYPFWFYWKPMNKLKFSEVSGIVESINFQGGSFVSERPTSFFK